MDSPGFGVVNTGYGDFIKGKVDCLRGFYLCGKGNEVYDGLLDVGLLWLVVLVVLLEYSYLPGLNYFYYCAMFLGMNSLSILTLPLDLV
jgi:hypothetical protein